MHSSKAAVRHKPTPRRCTVHCQTVRGHANAGLNCQISDTHFLSYLLLGKNIFLMMDATAMHSSKTAVCRGTQANTAALSDAKLMQA